MALGLLVLMANLMEMCKHCVVQSTGGRFCSKFPACLIHPNSLGFDHSDAELWHFTCTSNFGYVIQLSGISKGHNLYLFICCLRCQCFCVQHEFFTGQMSEVWALLGLQRSLIGTNNQFSAGPLWSFLPVTPSSFLQAQSMKQVHPTDCKIGAKQGLFDEPIGTKAREHSVLKQLTPKFSLSSKTSPKKMSLRFGFLQCTVQYVACLQSVVLSSAVHIYPRQTLRIWQLLL